MLLNINENERSFLINFIREELKSDFGRSSPRFDLENILDKLVKAKHE